MPTVGPSLPTTGSNTSGFGTYAWSNPSQVTSDDGSPATATLDEDSSQLLVAGGFGFGIASNATIDGIQVVWSRASQSGSNRPNASDAFVRVGSSSTIYPDDKKQAGNWPRTTPTSATYGGPTDLWGRTWTATEANAIIAVIAALSEDTGYIGTAYVYTCRVTIWYTDFVDGDGPIILDAELLQQSNAVTADSLVVVGGSAAIAQGDDVPSGDSTWVIALTASIVSSDDSLFAELAIASVFDAAAMQADDIGMAASGYEYNYQSDTVLGDDAIFGDCAALIAGDASIVEFDSFSTSDVASLIAVNVGQDQSGDSSGGSSSWIVYSDSALMMDGDAVSVACVAAIAVTAAGQSDGDTAITAILSGIVDVASIQFSDASLAVSESVIAVELAAVDGWNKSASGATVATTAGGESLGADNRLASTARAAVAVAGAAVLADNRPLGAIRNAIRVAISTLASPDAVDAELGGMTVLVRATQGGDSTEVDGTSAIAIGAGQRQAGVTGAGAGSNAIEVESSGDGAGDRTTVLMGAWVAVSLADIQAEQVAAAVIVARISATSAGREGSIWAAGESLASIVLVALSAISGDDLGGASVLAITSAGDASQRGDFAASDIAVTVIIVAMANQAGAQMASIAATRIIVTATGSLGGDTLTANWASVISAGLSGMQDSQSTGSAASTSVTATVSLVQSADLGISITESTQFAGSIFRSRVFSSAVVRRAFLRSV